MKHDPAVPKRSADAAPQPRRAAAAWHGTLLTRLATAGAHLAAADQPVAKRVHEIRKLLKESRALLRLAPPALAMQAETVRRNLKTVRARLGVARDAQAALDALDDLKRHAAIADGTRHTLRQVIRRHKRAAEAAPLQEAMVELSALLAGAVATVGAWSMADLDEKAMIGRAMATYRRARRRRPRGFVAAGVEPLHRLRTAVVDHRYQMEFLACGSSPTRQKRVRDLQRLRDLLGLHHDLAVLRTTASQAETVARDATFFRAIDKRQAIIAERAERLGVDVLRAKPKRLAESLLRHGAAVAAARRR